MTTRLDSRLLHPTPPDRGRLLDAAEVAALIGTTVKYVRRHIPHRVTLTRQCVRWYEADVKAWLESRRRA